MKKSAVNKLLSILAILLLTSSCTTNGSENFLEDTNESSSGYINNTENNASTISSSDGSFYPESEYSEFDLNTQISENAVHITLNGTSAESDTLLDIGEGYINITDGGDYVLSGNYSGQIIVNVTDENVHLILDGANIENDMAPIYIKAAKNALITLADGTDNTVTDSKNYTFAEGEDEPAAAIYSKDDLTINGNGTLTVNANYNIGIHSKDDLKIVSGTINVNSVGDAIKGKDSLIVKDGIININSNEDGLKSNNDSESEKGYVIIDGGIINVSAADDGIHAESWLVINEGNIVINKSYEGLEGKVVEINGGDIDVTASDDGINAASGSSSNTADFRSNGNNTKDNFNFDEGTQRNKGTMPDSGAFPDENFVPDDNFAPDENFTPDDSFMPDKKVQSMSNNADTLIDSEQQSNVRGGKQNGGDYNMNEIPSDYGFFSFNKGGDMMGGKGGNEAAEEGVYIKINGGNIRVKAGSDIIDSNGTFEQTGGTLITVGTSMMLYTSTDGIIDVNGDAAINGGTFIAFSRSVSSAGSLINLPTIVTFNNTNGADITITDSKGEVIVEISDVPVCTNLLVSSDKLVSGEEYTISSGETSTKVICSNNISYN